MKHLRLLILAAFSIGILPAPTFNLTNLERELLTSWLFEPIGWLDIACRVSDGQCARQAWEQNNAIDFVQWVRDNPQTDAGQGCTVAEVDCSGEMAMVAWMLDNDQVNITPPNRPEETAGWIAVLNAYDASIDAGFARAPQSVRNNKTQPIYDENSCPIGYTASDPQTDCIVTGSQPSGAHLARQQQIITKVLNVLQ